ncbi:siderophore ABC transporter substrate-binding protein [Pseudoroseicyclus tamaricis]|uniref:Siderophore ABC transporter substrate-binding protein n=1 Tax=Pseudoroseicyclus tamaricis TaxID=2705421 RepID=A0A6B2JIU0_9RHOB|nr:siderophore ABC transporter substrate-binding protein [Pseudoroseicyclus tamaricis]NDV01321.1 siderophore ABC transporter substrate-binding protein [Pseudoroseicyclus tamaricis]
MTRMFSTTCAAALAAFAAAPALADIEVQTYTGPVTVAENPETVVVYDMPALDNLDALGVPVAGSIAPIYVDYLQGYEGEMGTLFEPDYEALHALSPDLVIAGGRSSSVAGDLNDVAPTIDMTLWGDDVLAAMEEQLTAYGAIFGKEAEAEQLIANIEAQLAETRAAVEGQGDGLILMTNGPNISVYGPGSRFGYLYDAIGLTPAISAEDIESEEATHGDAISFEFIAEADPDWLLVLDRAAAIGSGDQSAEATLDNAIMRETSVWQDGRVVYLNSADLYIAMGGYTSTMTTLELIEDVFAGAGS